MAAPAVVVVWNSRRSGTDAFRLKNVTFSDDLSHPGVHHTSLALALTRYSENEWTGSACAASNHKIRKYKKTAGQAVDDPYGSSHPPRRYP